MGEWVGEWDDKDIFRLERQSYLFTMGSLTTRGQHVPICRCTHYNIILKTPCNECN